MPGPLNTEADIMSGGWRLHPQVVETNLALFQKGRGGPLCLQGVNTLPPVLRQPFPGVGCPGASLEPGSFVYLPSFLSPPLGPLRVQTAETRLVLVAPFWPNMPWFSVIQPLLDSRLWELPVQRNLLSQASGSLSSRSTPYAVTLH